MRAQGALSQTQSNDCVDSYYGLAGLHQRKVPSIPADYNQAIRPLGSGLCHYENNGRRTDIAKSESAVHSASRALAQTLSTPTDRHSSTVGPAQCESVGGRVWLCAGKRRFSVDTSDLWRNKELNMVSSLSSSVMANSVRVNRHQNVNRLLTGQVCRGVQDDSDSSSNEELQYGPGIVSRLKNKYMSMALRETGVRPSLRRVASLENVMDKETDSTPPDTVVATAAFVPDPRRSRPISRRESMKRARSVGDLARGFQPSKQSSAVQSAQKNREGHHAPDIETVVPINPIEPPKLPISLWHGNNKELSVENGELPQPDTVKTVKRLFEHNSINRSTTRSSNGSSVHSFENGYRNKDTFHSDGTSNKNRLRKSPSRSITKNDYGMRGQCSNPVSVNKSSLRTSGAGESAITTAVRSARKSSSVKSTPMALDKGPKFSTKRVEKNVILTGAATNNREQLSNAVKIRQSTFPSSIPAKHPEITKVGASFTGGVWPRKQVGVIKPTVKSDAKSGELSTNKKTLNHIKNSILEREVSAGHLVDKHKQKTLASRDEADACLHKNKENGMRESRVSLETSSNHVHRSSHLPGMSDTSDAVKVKPVQQMFPLPKDAASHSNNFFIESKCLHEDAASTTPNESTSTTPKSRHDEHNLSKELSGSIRLVGKSSFCDTEIQSTTSTSTVDVIPSKHISSVSGHIGPRNSPSLSSNNTSSPRNSSQSSPTTPVHSVNSTINPRRVKPRALVQNHSSLVFNFTTRPDVPNYVEDDGVILSRRHSYPKTGDSGYVLLPGFERGQSSDEDDLASLCLQRPPSPCNVVFLNANVIINGRSNVQRTSRTCKLAVSFDVDSTVTHEYISESSALDASGDDVASHSTGTLGSLSTYTPTNHQMNDTFELGVSRAVSHVRATHHESQPGDAEQDPLPTSDNSAWSSVTSDHLLF